MRISLSIIGVLVSLSPIMASARVITELEDQTYVAQSFDDGTITGRITNVHRFVGPDGTEYRQSDIVTRRLANYKANSQHCSVFKQLKQAPTGVCKSGWNGLN